MQNLKSFKIVLVLNNEQNQVLFCVLEGKFEKFCTTAGRYLLIKTTYAFLCFTSYFRTVSCFGNFICLSRDKTHKNTGKWPFALFLCDHRSRNNSSISGRRVGVGELGWSVLVHCCFSRTQAVAGRVNPVQWLFTQMNWSPRNAARAACLKR